MSDVITIRNARVLDRGVELKQSKKGDDYAEFTIMWSTSKKNRQTGEYENGPTKFVRVMLFGFEAKDVAAAVNGGDRVDVTGKIEHNPWTNKNGEEKDSWDLLAERVTLPVPRAGQGQQLQQQQQFGGGFNAAVNDSVPF